MDVGGDIVADNRDSEERRNEFVDAAEKLFRENGIVDTTISAIVKEMDVAKGLFYYYFKSKDDVIDAISEKYNEVFNEMMYASMDSKSDYESRLHQFVANTVNSFRDLDNKLSTDDDVDLSQLSMRSIDEAKSNAIAALVSMFEEGNENDELMLEHPKYYADILISGIIELVQQKEATDAEITEIILDLIERAGKD
jgi:AcrR family transcriptional regulator